MNSLLAKHVPEQDKDRFKYALDNSVLVLKPFADMLRERINSLGRITEEDFNSPNAFAALAFKQGRRAELELLLSLIPDSSK